MTKTKRAPKVIKTTQQIMIVFICVVTQWLLLELSMVSFSDIQSRSILANLVSFCVITTLIALIIALSGRAIFSMLFSLFVCTLWGIANCYVYDLHASPLRLSEFSNFSTALSVIKGFQFYLPKKVLSLLIIFMVSLSSILLLKKLLKDRHIAKTRLYGIGGLIISVGVVYNTI